MPTQLEIEFKIDVINEMIKSHLGTMTLLMYGMDGTLNDHNVAERFEYFMVYLNKLTQELKEQLKARDMKYIHEAFS